MAVIALSVLKLAATIDPAHTADDLELLDNLDGAEAEYAERVRPLPGTYVETVTLPAFLPDGVVAVSATLAAGTPVGVTYEALSRIVSSAYPHYYAPAVVLSYTVGPLPANHVRAIVNDVAEYWSRTQRSSAAGRPGFEADSYDAGASREMTFRPVMMYPRIRALAVSVVV